MQKVLVMGLAVAFAGTAAMATDINFSVQVAGENHVNVEPGEVVNYEVVGWLGDAANEGLALVGFDLVFSGDDLAAADTPLVDPMANFVRDLGITNPDGYGGTIIDGNLIQIGGGQNTIMNVPTNAQFPIGTVITGVAQTEQVLVTGSLTIPMEGDTFTLSLENPFANVIKEGETSDPFWATEAAGIGTVTNLTLDVGIDIAGTDPPNGAIDGRQPADLDDDCVTPLGWDAIEIEFTGDASGVVTSNFAITVEPDDVTPPSIVGGTAAGEFYTLTLDGPIPPAHWTTFTYTPTGTSTVLGALPGDADGNGTANPQDILALIDSLNGVVPLPEWGTDMDRSGASNPQDILPLIDLLNGAGCFDPWNGVSLP